MYIPEITLKSKKEIGYSACQRLECISGMGQVVFLDSRTVTLKDVEDLDKFYYEMCIKDTFDGSDVKFRFRVFMLKEGLFVVFIHHDLKYYLEVMDSIQDVNQKYTWFIEMAITCHKEILTANRD